MAIGSVTITPANRTTVSIKTPGQTSIVSPTFEPTLNVAFSDVDGVSLTGVENGNILIYNSENGTFEVGPITGADFAIPSITGGTF